MKFDQNGPHQVKAWNKIRENILDSDNNKILEKVKRYNIMKTNSKSDFLTKLDIIDSHPEIFDGKQVKLNK